MGSVAMPIAVRRDRSSSCSSAVTVTWLVMSPARRISTASPVRESVSSVKSYGEGPVVIWFLEDYRDDVVLVVRVQHFALSDTAD